MTLLNNNSHIHTKIAEVIINNKEPNSEKAKRKTNGQCKADSIKRDPQEDLTKLLMSSKLSQAKVVRQLGK